MNRPPCTLSCPTIRRVSIGLGGGTQTTIGLGGEGKEGLIALCSDAMSEGLNLQRASSVVLLDTPSVIRIAEQRVGRIDRMDSPHDAIDVWWLEDSRPFQSARRDLLIERYNLNERLMGNNIDLPDSLVGKKQLFSEEARQRVSTNLLIDRYKAHQKDGLERRLDDAFRPARELVGLARPGEREREPLVSEEIYEKIAGADALETTREERTQLKSDHDKVQGRLESEDLRGLHGRLEQARQDLDEAQAEVDRLERQAEAAKLLYETLTEKRSEARKKYLAPLREKVEDLLGRFFSAETTAVEFDEECGLRTLSRSTDGSFEFDQLSTGAKQQISVLIRLAMARLIAEERPHPVVLDDALSDTDPERFESNANILRSVARDMQIIMTTCHHDRHRRLGVTTKRMGNLKQRDERTSAPSS